MRNAALRLPCVAVTASLLLASNRGPVSYVDEDGAPAVRRGGGGLVSALCGTTFEQGLVRGAAGGGVLWVCAAITDVDRRAVRASGARLAEQAPGGVPVRMLDIDPVTFERAYNGMANATLWYLSHLLFPTATAPTFDARSRREWEAYAVYADAFAAALAEEAAPGARVLVQDYHLCLVPQLLRARRPDLRIGHFSHIPWAPPEYYRLLPDDVAGELLLGLLGADAVGFHSRRWADAFGRCCADVLGARWDGSCVEHDGRRTRVEVLPLGVDAGELRARAQRPDVQTRLPGLQEVVGDCQLLLRVDRTELSKNIVRGLEAYAELLRSHPQWRGRVVHVALAYPSRHDLPDYREYTAAVQRVAREVNEEFGTDGWVPVHLEVRDDYPRSLAAYLLADVLVVNPLRDGMNLVAKEGPVLSERGVGVVLSREAGAADELAGDARLVNPYDVTQTAAALHAALSEGREERAARSTRLAQRAAALPPSAWLAGQLAMLDA
jgi:trehalose 6-phosphate synthase